MSAEYCFRAPAPRLADASRLGDFLRRTAGLLPVRAPKPRKSSAKLR
ncbi:hypothetical protein [Nocardia tenerifensis]|nr:hypothetical protein [Nocardia tenerifensis]